MEDNVEQEENKENVRGESDIKVDKYTFFQGDVIIVQLSLRMRWKNGTTFVCRQLMKIKYHVFAIIQYLNYCFRYIGCLVP